MIRADRRPRDEALAHTHDLWARCDTLQADSHLVYGHLERGSRFQSKAFPDRRGNYQSACLVNGGSHGIQLTIGRLNPSIGMASGRGINLN